MQLGELDFRLIEILVDARVTPTVAEDGLEGYSYGHVRRRLARLAEETCLVERVSKDSALYAATDAGEKAVELRLEYEADSEMSQVEFYDRLHTEVLTEGDD